MNTETCDGTIMTPSALEYHCDLTESSLGFVCDVKFKKMGCFEATDGMDGTLFHTDWNFRHDIILHHVVCVSFLKIILCYIKFLQHFWGYVSTCSTWCHL